MYLCSCAAGNFGGAAGHAAFNMRCVCRNCISNENIRGIHVCVSYVILI